MRHATPILLLVAACGGDDILAARKIPSALEPDVAEVAAANNQFACDVYRKVVAETGNTFFSPFSISTALAMVDAGAANNTDAQLRTTLHFTLPGERLHTAYGALLDSLAIGRDHGAYTLATANRLFGQQGFPFLPSYLTITKNDYGAELLPVDFAADPEAARHTVNQWVADQTDAKIPELFPQGALDASTRLALANAIVFRGDWANHFDHDRTQPSPFHLADGSTVMVPMMGKHDVIAGHGIPGGRLGVLPFDGKDLSFVVLLPATPDGLPALEAQLDGATLASSIDAATNGEEAIDVRLPKLQITSSLDLGAALIALGITDAFSPDVADFSALDGDRDLSIQSAVHKAVLTVDEDGAEAVAATGVGIGITSLPAPFEVDRPFAFVIYDHVTHSVLFMGRVQDPLL
jgi:serpin B